MQKPWWKQKNSALKCYSLPWLQILWGDVLKGQIIHHGRQQVFEHLFQKKQPWPLPGGWAGWTSSLVWQVQPETSSCSSHQTKTQQMLPAQVLGWFDDNLSFKTASTPHQLKVIFKIVQLNKKEMTYEGFWKKKKNLISWWGVILGKCLVAGSMWVFRLPLCAGTYGLSGCVWSGSCPVL